MVNAGASFEEGGGHTLKVVHRTPILILIQHRAKHAHDVGRVCLGLLLLTVEEIRQTGRIQSVLLLSLANRSHDEWSKSFE
jgi:hypothetical protein